MLAHQVSALTSRLHKTKSCVFKFVFSIVERKYVATGMIFSSLHHVCVSVQVDKVVQLYETMMTRHTTMVVGPTGGGKSVVIKTLAESQTK